MFPTVGQTVTFRVVHVNDIAVQVVLLDFNDREAWIPLPDLSRRPFAKQMFYKKYKIGLVGQTTVQRVNIEQGWIDLNRLPPKLQSCSSSEEDDDKDNKI